MQLSFMRYRIEEAVSAMVAQRIDMPTVDDVPEYFFTELDQTKVEAVDIPVSITVDEAQQLLRYLDDTVKGLQP